MCGRVLSNDSFTVSDEIGRTLKEAGITYFQEVSPIVSGHNKKILETPPAQARRSTSSLTILPSDAMSRLNKPRSNHSYP